MNYGLQLYSVRDVTKIDFDGALRAVAEMGYKMVEPAGFFGLPANEVKAMIDHYGLTVCSTHTKYTEVFENTLETIKYHKEIGCKNIILPSVPLTNREEVDFAVENKSNMWDSIKNEPEPEPVASDDEMDVPPSLRERLRGKKKKD